MKWLVLGGTQFIGRHVVEHALARGHEVSVLNRGVSADALPRGVERLRGDRDAGADGLRALAGHRWDACIDVSGYTTHQVRASTTALRDRVARYVYVSAVMTYGDPRLRPVRETHPRVPPWTGDVVGTDAVNGDNYGALKVANEDLVGALFPGRCALLRPQVVVGPHDPSGRYAAWVQRAGRGGPMLAPGDGADHLQVIDVRDLARFVVRVVEGGLGGAFNLAGPRFDWAAFVGLLGVADSVWVADALLRADGLTPFDLPLYRPEHGPRAGLMDVSAARALAAGLVLTDPVITLRDVRACPAPPAPWLAPERETALIERARRALG
jgi:2'-hydroxyisoflavone reductase